MNDRTEHNPGSDRAPRRKRWRLTLWTFAGFIVLLMVLFLAFRWSLNRAVDAELAAIREAGYPATPQELNDWYPDVPEDENAALVLIDAFGLMRLPKNQEESKNLPFFGNPGLPPPAEPLPREQVAAIEAFLADNANALELLHKGAAMERSRYPVDLSVGLVVDLPSLSELRSGANLLELEAIWHAEHGRAEEAARSVRLMLGLAQSLENEPVMISQLVRLALQSLAVETLKRVVHQVDLGDAALAGLINDLADAEHPSAINRAMVGERAITGGVFPLVGDVDHPLMSIYHFSGVGQLGRLTHLNAMGDYVAASELPPHEQAAAFEAAAGRADDLPFYAIFTEMMLPAVDRATQATLLTITQLRVARTALAVERYRLAHGELPDDLSALAPEFIDALPADPFTGKPLKYQKSESGYTVYSVGPNEVDDGGTPPLPDESYRAPGVDVPFTVER